nr:unnamed protein product [Callosobruchus chinensis]
MTEHESEATIYEPVHNLRSVIRDVYKRNRKQPSSTAQHDLVPLLPPVHGTCGGPSYRVRIELELAQKNIDMARMKNDADMITKNFMIYS